jgi:hypothetical protein
MWVVSFIPRSLYSQGKSSCYPLDRRLGGPQNRSGRGGEVKKYLASAGTRNPDYPARSSALYHWAIPIFECHAGRPISWRTDKPQSWRARNLKGLWQHIPFESSFSPVLAAQRAIIICGQIMKWWSWVVLCWTEPPESTSCAYLNATPWRHMGKGRHSSTHS